MLRWAAVLQEIGLSIAHNQYHKHGSYLLTHLNMPRFAHGEQRRLAALVRGHRRKMPLAEFGKLPAARIESKASAGSPSPSDIRVWLCRSACTRCVPRVIRLVRDAPRPGAASLESAVPVTAPTPPAASSRPPPA